MEEFTGGHQMFMASAMNGPERDAADFMAELHEENPETYETWLRITNREEFNEKFRRSFISALCKFCINRKQMELARYRRDFVASVLAYTKADIGVNLFCDKNGGGFLNNSLKSRRAYQKRRRECGWQEQQHPAPTSPFLPQGSALSTLLQTFRQQQQAIRSPPESVAEILRRTSSLEPMHNMRTPSPPSAQDNHSTTLDDSPLADTTVKISDRASSSSSSSTASLINVFIRYRRVNEEDGWKDVDVKQSRLSFGSFATAQHLYNSLIEKWQLAKEADRLILRVFDKEFEEFVDIEENYLLVSLENHAKYELIHRVSTYDLQNESDQFKNGTNEMKNNNVLFDEEAIEATRLGDEFVNDRSLEVPNTDLNNILKEFQDNAGKQFGTQNDNLQLFNGENPLELFARNAAILLRANKHHQNSGTSQIDEKPSDQPFFSLFNTPNLPFNAMELLENLVGHSFLNVPTKETTHKPEQSRLLKNTQHS